MNRDINTIGYLPLYVQEYKEIKEICKNQDLELNKILLEIDKTKVNQFILTADSNGLKRFEKLVNLKPKENEDLEVRRQRVLTRWQDDIPYTYKWLDEKLLNLYGAFRYEIIPSFNDYVLEIVLKNPSKGEVEELIYILENYIPVNLIKIATKYNSLAHNLYTANIIKTSKDIKVKRQNLIPNIKSTFYQGIFISKVRYRKIGFTVSDFEPKNIPIKINFERN